MTTIYYKLCSYKTSYKTDCQKNIQFHMAINIGLVNNQTYVQSTVYDES